MADEQTPAETEANVTPLTINAQYIKDLSFEVPNSPSVFVEMQKNSPDINWKNKVHEVLEGFNTISELPLEEPWCLIHDKTIERQEKQNNYYNTI